MNYAYGQEGETLGVSGSTEPATYAYDALYRLSALTDGNGHATHYYYKQQGYLDAVTYPGYAGPAPVYNSAADDYSNITGPDSVRCPAYDADGNVLRRIDGNGVETDYTYNADPQSLLTLMHYVYPSGYSGGTTGDVSLAYDAYGQRAGMTDGVGSQSYAYDDNNDLLSDTTTYTGLPAQSISYGYYPNGSRQTMSTPAGGFSYSYDAVGRMTGLSNPYGEASSWQYLDNGWLWKQTLAGGTATAYTRNALGEVTDQKTLAPNGTTVLSDFSGMGYDGVGNRRGMATQISTYTASSAFAYDNRNQLTQEMPSQAGNPNQYDAAGNGLLIPYGGGDQISQTYNADNQGNQYAGNTYDGNGNSLGYGTYDPEGRLTQKGSSLTAGYRGDGLRAWKQNSSGARTYFVYDGNAPVCELNGSGGITAVNTFGANGLLSRNNGSSVLYTFDPSGNAVETFTPSGGLVNTLSYVGYAFGAGRLLAGGSYTVGPYTFGGQWGGYTDAETGLVLMTHRYYDPSTGRFLTRDPIGYAGGINLYAYTGNDPVNRADPLGLWSVSIGVGIMVAIPGSGWGGDIAITIGDGGFGYSGDTYSGVGVGAVATVGGFVGASPDPLPPGSTSGPMVGGAGATDVGEGGSGSYWHTPPGVGGVGGWKGGPSFGAGSGAVMGSGTTFSNIHPWPQPAPYDNGTGSSCPTNWHEGDGNGGNTSPGQFMN